MSLKKSSRSAAIPETALNEARAQHQSLMGRLQPDAWLRTQDFVDALNEIGALRGRLLTIREYRYIDVAAIDAMSESLAQAHETVQVRPPAGSWPIPRHWRPWSSA